MWGGSPDDLFSHSSISRPLPKRDRMSCLVGKGGAKIRKKAIFKSSLPLNGSSLNRSTSAVFQVEVKQQHVTWSLLLCHFSSTWISIQSNDKSIKIKMFILSQLRLCPHWYIFILKQMSAFCYVVVVCDQSCHAPHHPLFMAFQFSGGRRRITTKFIKSRASSAHEQNVLILTTFDVMSWCRYQTKGQKYVNTTIWWWVGSMRVKHLKNHSSVLVMH